MSSSCLIRWCEYFLFGSPSPTASPPPAFKPLLLALEAENIPWSHILLQGGFTAFPHQVHGDLSTLTDYLENQWFGEAPSPYEPSPFKTRAVAKFWEDLRVLLARRDAIPPPALPDPPDGDDAVLQALFDGHPGPPFHYESAAFWGEVARRFVHLRRPEAVSPLPRVPEDHWKRVLQLYDVTCQARGQWVDPLTLHLVHPSEYVNAAHWQSARNLEAFLRDRPSHPLARAVQALLKRTVDDLLRGERPSTLTTRCPRLDALLHNVRVIHESVQQVPHADAPPRLIDVLQRLLALSERDGLWEKTVPRLEPARDPVGTSLLYLTEQLRMAERERHVLWKHVMDERNEESAPERPPRTCCSDSCARDTRPGAC